MEGRSISGEGGTSENGMRLCTGAGKKQRGLQLQDRARKTSGGGLAVRINHLIGAGEVCAAYAGRDAFRAAGSAEVGMQKLDARHAGVRAAEQARSKAGAA